MIDGPGVENGFCCSEDVLHLEQLAISQHGGEWAQGGVGSQEPQPKPSIIGGVTATKEAFARFFAMGVKP